jgi:hypothetical protein
MITATPSTVLDRAGLLERFTRMRQRTRAFFDLLDESEYFERPSDSAIRSSSTSAICRPSPSTH